MYAIVKVGGKQYRVEKGDSLVVDRMSDGEGAKVTLEPLLLRPDKGDPVVAPSELAKIKVEAVVRGHERGPKLHVLKFKPKKGYKRRQGHRSELTRLEIGDIKQLSRRPAGRAQSGASGGGKPAAKRASGTRGGGSGSARRPAAKEKQEEGNGS
jgi:large subunit ribosomal protein L21